MAAGMVSDIWLGVIKASEVGEMSGPVKTTCGWGRKSRSSFCEVMSGEGLVFHFSRQHIILGQRVMDSFLKLLVPVFLQTQIFSPMLLQHREESDFMAFLF